MKVDPRSVADQPTPSDPADADPDLAASLRAVLNRAQALAGGGAVAIRIGTTRSREAVVATDPVAYAAEMAQLEHDEGPGFAVLAAGDAIVVDDLAADVRWLHWRSSVHESGVRSCLSLPLATSHASLMGVHHPGFGPEWCPSPPVGEHCSSLVVEVYS